MSVQKFGECGRATTIITTQIRAGGGTGSQGIVSLPKGGSGTAPLKAAPPSTQK